MIETPLTHHDVYINGVRLHIVEAGDADATPVILLHGFPEFWYGWHNQIDALVNAGFRLIIPDQRGYNLSDKPDEVAAYSLDVLSDDIVGLIDYAGQERGLVVGHDWGGGAAWWAANRYPERIAKLTVLNIPHHAAFNRAVKQDPEQQRKSLYMAFFQLPVLPEIVTSVFDGGLLARWAFRDSAAFTEADLQKYRTAWKQPGARQGMLNWYRAVRKTPPQSLPSPRITVPTTLIWGMQDPVMKTDLAHKSIELCDDGHLHLIDHASHWVQHEAAGEVNRVLIDWLRD
jgi:epoxide hydrolase 4